MSMTVKIAMQGMTDLEVLLAALREMRITAHPVENNNGLKNKQRFIRAVIKGHRVDFTKNKNRTISMVGDGDWRIMRDKIFYRKLKQQYSLEAVKKKVIELSYHIASTETLEDGSIKLVARAWR